MSFARTIHFMAAAAAAATLTGPALAGPALLYDAASGRVLYSEDAGQPWFPASLTKLMTAYVVFDAWKTGRVVRESKLTVSVRANGQPRMRLGLGAGKEITYDDAMAALIIKSANDIAVALAEAVAGSEAAFVEEMNATALRLGMYGTRFINSHGLPGEGQYTTAHDLAVLAQAMQRDFPQHMHFFSQHTAQIGNKMIGTHNSVLIHVEGGDGMKTGFTCSAGYNIVASATRNGRRLVAIVLGEASKGKRALRTAALLEYGFKVLAWKALFPAATIYSQPEGAFDRELVRTANLTKRYKDCVAPEPPPGAVVADAAVSKDTEASPAKKGPTVVATAAIAKDDVAAKGAVSAPAKATSSKTKAKGAANEAKAAKATNKRRTATKRAPPGPDGASVFSLIVP